MGSSFDPRFPNQNQSKRCFVNFVDYKRCIKTKGEDYKGCDYFKQVTNSLCPGFWINDFNEKIENDIFPTKI